MKDLLFEIGVEELPASYIGPALSQMKALAEEFFRDAELPHGLIRVEGTPRRLVLMVAGLAERQEDKSEEVMGPSAKAAYTADGKPGPVAEGFARGKGVELAALSLRATPKGDYVFATVLRKGRPTSALLEEWLPLLVKKLVFPKSMRWSDGGPLRFARPIGWLCAVYGDRPLSFQLEFLQSAPRSFGHRFLAPQPFDVPDAASYERQLAAADVVLSFDERVARIDRGLRETSAALGDLVEDPDLVAVSANLVETPGILMGRFDDRYLALPQEVIVQVLREHQYCFAVRARPASLGLRGAFLAVTNGCRENLGAITEGNARVIRARLEDASFFFKEDQKTGPEARLEELKQVVWQEGLGSMREKVDRVAHLAAWLAARLSPDDADTASRAALLCKSDLCTLMIGEKEFASLQGVMGGIYAGLAGEAPAVAAAIAEHYRPRFSGDAIPSTRAGQCVALADKMDDLVGLFGSGRIPTGSQDPYALRRKAAGIVAILRAQQKDLSFSEFAAEAAGLFGAKLKVSGPELAALLQDFYRQRLENALLDGAYPPDLVSAILSRRHDLTKESFDRAEALQEFSKRGDFDGIVQAFSRVNNILSKPFDRVAVRHELMEPGAERDFFAIYSGLCRELENLCAAGEFPAALKVLVSLKEPIDRYFDGVMVMAEDAALRQNRLSFLAAVSGTLNLIANFTQLVKK